MLVATWVLASFTIVLAIGAIVTAILTAISYKNLKQQVKNNTNNAIYTTLMNLKTTNINIIHFYYNTHIKHCSKARKEMKDLSKQKNTTLFAIQCRNSSVLFSNYMGNCIKNLIKKHNNQINTYDKSLSKPELDSLLIDPELYNWAWETPKNYNEKSESNKSC